MGFSLVPEAFFIYETVGPIPNSCLVSQLRSRREGRAAVGACRRTHIYDVCHLTAVGLRGDVCDR